MEGLRWAWRSPGLVVTLPIVCLLSPPVAIGKNKN